MSATWPGGARAALSLSFDNLGEAAEIEMGAASASALGNHVTATRVVPALLEALGERGLLATFFVEGLNAEVYPDLLREIDSRGHEVAYHAWRHEQWGDLGADEQVDNLAGGVEAFERLGLKLDGMRPPGGGLGAGGLDVLREAGLRYCSPAGAGASAEGGIALLPFRWRHVDASCLLPGLAPVRERMSGSPDPIEPDDFLGHLEGELERLAADGGFATTVLHPITIEAWFGEERLAAFLDIVAARAGAGELWVAPLREIAGHVHANAASFEGATTLDATSWSS